MRALPGCAFSRVRAMVHVLPLVLTIALAIVAGALFVLLPGGGGAEAGWLTRLAREAGEAGADGAGGAAGRLARTGMPGLDEGLSVVRKLPDSGDAVRLAAHVTPEGHWSFANRNGEVFTAANESEMARVVSALAPDADDAGKANNLALYLDQKTIFSQRERLDALPAHARLYVTADGKAYRLERGGEDTTRLVAKIRSNVDVPIGTRATFEETAWQLSRRLNRADIRVVALDTGGADTLRTAPVMAKGAKGTGQRAEVDRIKPDRLMEAFREVRGQTVLVKGRIEDGAFVATPMGGSERRFDLIELSAAAARHDVNLVVLRSGASRQPGGRNWLWQRVEIDGLTEAMQRPTYADFLNALGERRGVLSVEVRPQGEGRVMLQAEPLRTGDGAAPFGDVVGDIGSWVGHVASEVTGSVLTDAVTASLNSKERQEELDWRIVPGIPSFYQIGYLVGIVCGVAGWGMARTWWRRVWKKELREEYGSTFGYVAARVVKAIAFVLVFLPVVGIPAFLTSIALQIWGWVTLPFRVVGWIWGKVTARA